MEPKDGYLKAEEVLEDNFGRKNIIARAFIDKLQKGGKMKAEDEKGFRTLFRDLQECDITLKRLNFQSDLNNFENISNIFKRLLYSSQTRWLRVAADIEKRRENLKFSDLVEFVKEKAEVSNPLLPK